MLASAPPPRVLNILSRTYPGLPRFNVDEDFVCPLAKFIPRKSPSAYGRKRKLNIEIGGGRGDDSAMPRRWELSHEHGCLPIFLFLLAKFLPSPVPPKGYFLYAYKLMGHATPSQSLAELANISSLGNPPYSSINIAIGGQGGEARGGRKKRKRANRLRAMTLATRGGARVRVRARACVQRITHEHMNLT